MADFTVTLERSQKERGTITIQADTLEEAWEKAEKVDESQVEWEEDYETAAHSVTVQDVEED